MKSPESTIPDPDTSAEQANVLALESKIEQIEEWQKVLRTAIEKGDFDTQKIATEKLREELANAKKLQAKIEGRIESPENMLSIDRTINLVDDFLKKSEEEGGLGIGWLDAEKPIDESDDRNEGLTEIDLSKVKLDINWLPEGKSSLGGEKRLEALKGEKDVIRLDLFTLASLWKLFKSDPKEFEQKLTIIAEANSLKLEDLKKKAIFFDGTILKSSDGSRRALYLYWDGSEWDWDDGRLDLGWGDRSPSLVLAS